MYDKFILWFFFWGEGFEREKKAGDEIREHELYSGSAFKSAYLPISCFYLTRDAAKGDVKSPSRNPTNPQKPLSAAVYINYRVDIYNTISVENESFSK